VKPEFSYAHKQSTQTNQPRTQSPAQRTTNNPIFSKPIDSLLNVRSRQTRQTTHHKPVDNTPLHYNQNQNQKSLRIHIRSLFQNDPHLPPLRRGHAGIPRCAEDQYLRLLRWKERHYRRSSRCLHPHVILHAGSGIS
jgi:hypothetical protein